MTDAGNRSVVDGIIYRSSPSQVVKHRRCKRAWYLSKVLRLEPPRTDAQAFGTATHREIELWFLEGKAPQDPSAVAVLPHLPTSGPGVLVEASLEDPALTVAGIPFKGFIDLVHFTSRSSCLIVDFKTRKAFGKKRNGKEISFCLTPDELANDVQLLSYARWAAEKEPALENFTLVHAYLKRDSKRGDYRWVEKVVSRSHVMETFDGTVASEVEAMKTTARATTWEAVPGNPEACDDFGGCPYLTSHCYPRPFQRFKAFRTLTPPLATGEISATAPPETLTH